MGWWDRFFSILFFVILRFRGRCVGYSGGISELAVLGTVFWFDGFFFLGFLGVVFFGVKFVIMVVSIGGRGKENGCENIRFLRRGILISGLRRLGSVRLKYSLVIKFSGVRFLFCYVVVVLFWISDLGFSNFRFISLIVY